MKSLGNRLTLFLLAASVLGLMACAGGSGSSGFDISAASEGAAIQRALDKQECLERKGLTICPATEGSPAVPGSPTPAPSTTPGPMSSPSIDTQLDHTTSLACSLIPASDTCLLSVLFTPRGFEPDAQFYVAVRTNEAGAPWTINTDGARSDALGSFDAPLQAPVQSMEIQVAILVFNTLPATLAIEVVELADSGADFAYVTHVLMLSPSS